MLSKRIPHCFAHEALPLFNSKLLLKQIFYSKHTRKKQTATRRRYSRTWHHEITKESFTLIKNVDQHQWTMKWQLNFCTTGECWENLITDNFGENKAVLKDSVNLRHHAYLTLHCENDNNGPNWNNSCTRFFLREGTQSSHANCLKTDMISCFERHKLANTSRLFTWTRPDIEKLHCDGITTRHITAISVGATLPCKLEKVDIYIFVSARYTWRLLNNTMCDILSSPI